MSCIFINLRSRKTKNIKWFPTIQFFVLFNKIGSASVINNC